MTGSISVYEAWVKTLRAWRREPLTDLSGLPALDETSFPPATYERFLNHLNEAINEFMARWQSQLSSALGGAADGHAVARVLVDARVGLRMRIQLARHPAFPETIRAQLVSQAESDIKGLQAQLEGQAMNVVSTSSASNRPEREATLRLIRDNALTAVLDPAFSVSGPVGDREMQRADAVTEAWLNAESAALDDFVPRKPMRRVFAPETEE